MVDVLTTSQRSYNMSRIRSKGTNPEKYLEKLLRASKVSGFKKHPKGVVGKPDIYFPQEKVAVFVDGCFWHGCKECFQMPKTHRKFWREKIKSNIHRDRTVNTQLRSQDIKVIRIWDHELKKSPDEAIQRIMSELNNASSPKVLDLFAGAGGLSEGFIKAGCEMIGHVELDKDACDTLITRMVYHALSRMGKIEEYKNYILGNIDRDELIKKYELQKEKDSVICAKIEKKNYKEIIEQIKKRLAGEHLDIIVGGPPCQAYSNIGRARDKNGMRRDKRNFLYKYYVEFLKALRPKIFVFENVQGLESAGKGKYLADMRRLMTQAGYQTDYKVINAVNFGVPQNRKRIILVGWSKDSRLERYPDFPVCERSYIVENFLNDLPRIRAGEGQVVREDFLSCSSLLKDIGIVNPELHVLMSHISRPHTEQDLEIYRLAILAKKENKNLKYNLLPQRLKTHKNEKGFLDRFKVVDSKSKGSHTVVAHIARDGHYYIHPDLRQNRSLSVREAARLQTFPDDYKFEGSRTAQYRQIGNAVPPMLSWIIAKEIIKHL